MLYQQMIIRMQRAAALLATAPGLVLGKPGSSNWRSVMIYVQEVGALEAFALLAPRLQCVGLAHRDYIMGCVTP